LNEVLLNRTKCGIERGAAQLEQMRHWTRCCSTGGNVALNKVLLNRTRCGI